jgi:hypothetical protein
MQLGIILGKIEGETAGAIRCTLEEEINIQSQEKSEIVTGQSGEVLRQSGEIMRQSGEIFV